MTALDHIADLIKRAMGVDVETIGRTTLANAVRSRVNARGLADAEAYRLRLRDAGEELSELIELVVVPETWFFRAPEAFHALTSVVAKEWLPANPHGTLRVLSAPCSTGEEPYSIAMALLDAGFSPGRFRVTAVDISERALEQAGRATYGRNSFRGGDLEFRDRHFTAVPGGYQLHARVRDLVEFRQCNLVAEDPLAGTGLQDAIFCRNVLIYFDAPTQERVVRNLGLRLKPEGLLFVGPAETFVARTAGFTAAADMPGAFVCRRTDAKSPPRAVSKPKRNPVPAWTPPPPAARPVRETAGKPAASPSPAKPVPSPEAARNTLDAVNELANADRMPEALAACETHLREHGASAAAYCLLGLLRDTTGDWTEAAALYRKALFLEPDHQEALLHLAMLLEKQGDAPGAKRLRLRAQRAGEVVR